MENTELNLNAAQTREANGIDKGLHSTLEDLARIGQEAAAVAKEAGMQLPEDKAEEAGVLTKLNGAATPMMTGAVLGVGTAVLIQLASSKGSVQGAIAAAVVGGAAVYSARKTLCNEALAPHTGLGCGLVTGLVSNRIAMYAGRVVSDYFPSEEKVLEEVVG